MQGVALTNWLNNHIHSYFLLNKDKRNTFITTPNTDTTTLLMSTQNMEI